MAALLLLLFVTGLSALPEAAIGRPPNVLVVVMDDIGVDKLGAYGEHPGAGPTPTLDLLASRGVLFRNAWGGPTCSPARATSLTGRYPPRHGIGTGVQNNGGPFNIDDDAELSLPEALRAHGYRTAAVGKWHLGSDEVLSPAEQELHPVVFGFERYAGALFNVADYFVWDRTVATPAGASTEECADYITTRQVDDALEAIADFGRDPWFVWLALSAPHKPTHVPPAHLHTQGDLVGASDPALYRAMVEALDTELRRLLGAIPPAVLARTVVMVYGDNGTYASANTAPFGGLNNNKGDLREGGINVPFLVCGPRVTPGESAALITVADVMPTVLQLVGAPPADAELDGTSFAAQLLDPSLPGQDVVFMERHKPNGPGPWNERRRAVRGERFKLIRRESVLQSSQPDVEFFDLLNDPFETESLVTGQGALLPGAPAGAAEALAELETAMAAIAP